jgi:transcription antitermination protein NusB
MAGGIGPRRRAREIALQVLFSLDLNPGVTPAQALAQFWHDFVYESRPEDPTADADPPREVVSFAETLVGGTVENLAELDGIIQRASKNWRLERMARVDRNVLRLATYELRYVPEVPAKVVINEAIEVAKRYGASESPAFVNGLLDRISQELKRS